MKGRTPSAEERKWMSAASEFGCVVCKKYMRIYSPAEIHHIDGKTKPLAHLNSIGLCYSHHRAGEDNERFTSRHPSKAKFVERYGKEQDLREWLRDNIKGD